MNGLTRVGRRKQSIPVYQFERDTNVKRVVTDQSRAQKAKENEIKDKPVVENNQPERDILLSIYTLPSALPELGLMEHLHQNSP